MQLNHNFIQATDGQTCRMFLDAFPASSERSQTSRQNINKQVASCKHNMSMAKTNHQQGIKLTWFQQ